MVKTWRVEEFHGIDQSRDGSLCNEGTSPDARNMDTANGDLSVARGYVRHIPVPIPGSGPVRRLRILKLYNTLIYAAIAEDEEGCCRLYAYDPEGGEWETIYQYPDTVKGRYWDFLQCNIGNYDYLLIACGEHQMVKWDGISGEAALFGSGETAYESTVSAYTASTLTVTLTDGFDEALETRMKRAGLVLGDVANEVESVDRSNKKVTLKKAPSPAPAVGTVAKVRGGVSIAPVNYLAMHFSRLFAAGDPQNPNRLYYSQISGDGRSIEDWSADAFSPNSGGGFIEIGDSAGDPIMGIIALATQLLIIKRYSIYRLLGDRPSNYTVEKVDAEAERMTHTSVAMHGDIAFYLTPAGLYYFNNITVQPMPDARNIRSFLEGLRVSQTKACQAKDRLYFTCYKGDSEDARDYDNHMLVYDIRRRTYMVRDGFDVADITALDGVVYMVNSARCVYRFNEGDDYVLGYPAHRLAGARPR